MHTRREFIRDAAVLAGAAGWSGAFAASIGRALAIEPDPGSSWRDAEHVVILMQENRSFDHAFGTLRGVRGFNDPRAITLPDKNPVWVQTNAAGQSYVPFRLDIKDTMATWMGCLPHSWTDQLDARNAGRYDRWLWAKRSGTKEYADLPLTLGYHNRADIPFYYALADAFTICDQHFCSSLTGTTPNRLFLWSGTVREKQTADSPPAVRNEDVDYGRWANWTTFPERLEDLGISWKVYQNELSIDTGLTEREDGWLGNFTDNPLEFFTRYRVLFSATHRAYRDKMLKDLPGEIDALQKKLAIADQPAANKVKLKKQLADATALLKRFEAEKAEYTQEKWDALSARDKNLHQKAFSTNTGDPAYRQVAELNYRDGDTDRKLWAPKGDLFHQFRKDVADGKLPAVSWLVAPQNFSDHPSAAWYGSWYLAEAINILTHNPEVWKKTVFILTYDENDGYFDHVPPFMAPRPNHPETGRVSAGIDTGVEYLEREGDLKRTSPLHARGGPIGLGYRVPMIVASPWSRGGAVCSQVFDHTSVLQFLEKLLSHKTGKKVEEPNISQWRRTVCGDLTSVFQSAGDTPSSALPFPPRDTFLEEIHRAFFKKEPDGFHALTAEQVEQLRRDPKNYLLPKQEPGIRRSCPLPYQLGVDGALSKDRSRFVIHFEAGKELFGDRAAGSPFIVYAFGPDGNFTVRDYAVRAGDRLEDSWPLADFPGGKYHFRVYGPNGFFREFRGSAGEPAVDVRFAYATAGSALTGGAEVVATNRDAKQEHSLRFRGNAYSQREMTATIASGRHCQYSVETDSSHGWYDFTVGVEGSEPCERRYAGRVETGKWSYSDPAMGK